MTASFIITLYDVYPVLGGGGGWGGGIWNSLGVDLEFHGGVSTVEDIIVNVGVLNIPYRCIMISRHGSEHGKCGENENPSWC